MKKRRLYVAYGSNLNIEQMQRRCPFARLIGTTTIADWRLMYKGSQTGSYLTIEKKPGYHVPVAVWSVTDLDEENLDRYEGFPRFYYKREFPVQIRRGSDVVNEKAFVYIMAPDRHYGLPSDYYINTCVSGYEEMGFDLSILDKAYDDTADAINELENMEEPS